MPSFEENRLTEIHKEIGKIAKTLMYQLSRLFVIILKINNMKSKLWQNLIKKSAPMVAKIRSSAEDLHLLERNLHYFKCQMHSICSSFT